MLRRLLTFASAVSLLLCVATAALWVRSHAIADRLHGRLWGDRSFLVASKQGRLVAVGFRWHGAAGGWPWAVRSHDVNDVMSFPLGDVGQYANRLGFGRIDRPTYLVMNPVQDTPRGRMMIFGAATATLNGSGIVLPTWLPLLLFAVLPAAYLAGRLRRTRRARLGLCLACGYDVRATPERCPECGAVPGAKT